eukprot:211772_1
MHHASRNWLIDYFDVIEYVMEIDPMFCMTLKSACVHIFCTRRAATANNITHIRMFDYCFVYIIIQALVDRWFYTFYVLYHEKIQIVVHINDSIFLQSYFLPIAET